MSTLLWFNEDGLNPDHRMVQDFPDALRVYVFDVSYIQQWQITQHRVQFIYESLLEIPEIQIYKGETVPVLQQLLDQHQISQVVTTETPNHIIKTWQQALRNSTKIVTYPELYPAQDAAAFRRFSRYWNKHDRAWLAP